MAGTGIDVEITGFLETNTALRRMAEVNIQEVLEFAGEELLNISEEAFKDEADPVTEDDWDESQRAKADGGLTLTHRAQLRRSMVYEVSGDKVTIGSNLIYAGIHNEGGQAGRGKKITIPKRTYLGVPEGFNRRLMEDPDYREILGL